MKFQTTILILLLFVSASCSSQKSKENAIAHLDEVLGAGLPVKLQIERMNKDLLKYFMKIWQEQQSISSEEHKSYSEQHKLFLAIYDTSISQINELTEFGDKAKLKIGMKKYLDDIKKFEEETTPLILEICADGELTEAEVNKLSNFANSIEDFKKVSNVFGQLQRKFYAEFKLQDEEINKVFAKYDL